MAWWGWAETGWGSDQTWSHVSASEQPQLQGTHYGPSPATAAQTQVWLLQQKGRFRKAPRKAEPQTSDIGTSVEAYKRSALIPSVKETAFYASPYPIGTLIKPLFFTVGSTGCAFGSAAIWQYESPKFRVQSYFDDIKVDGWDSIRPQKGDFRKENNKWWNNLSDGQ